MPEMKAMEFTDKLNLQPVTNRKNRGQSTNLDSAKTPIYPFYIPNRLRFY
jgi:hypothetical protein